MSSHDGSSPSLMPPDESGATNLGFYGGIYVLMHHRKSVLDAPLESHSHHKDHLTFVTAGSVRVDWTFKDGTSGSKVFVAPTFFIQDMNVKHCIVPLEDNSTWWCVFATEEDGKPIIDDAHNPYIKEK